MDRTKKNIVELTRMDAQECLHSEKIAVRVLLEDVRSLLNVGAVLRTSDAFMIDEVVMCGITGTPPHPEIHKSALGAEDSVRWRHAPSCVEELQRLKDEGWHILVLEQTHGSVPLDEYTPTKDKKYALVCGNEVHGVSQQVVDMADTVLEIPQCGAKHSLNVSVSTAIALWTLFRELRIKN